MRSLPLTSLGFVGAVLLTGAAAAQTYTIGTLTPFDTAADDLIGSAVDLSGDTVVLGGYGHDHLGVGGTGGAWIFERSPGGAWLETTELHPSDQPANARFGYAVAVDGDVAIVGAPRDDTSFNDGGSAYVFERQGDGTWLEMQKLEASDVANGWDFGNSVEIEGDRILVGSPGSISYFERSGAGYVFERQPDDSWAEVAKLDLDDALGNDEMGHDASLSGDRVILGAHLQDDNGGSSGAAYVFARQPDGTWAFEQKLLASDGAAIDYFGYSVAISGDLAVSGARLHDDPGNGDGAAYIYERQPDGTWLEIRKLIAPSEKPTHFGHSVAIDGGAVLIGAIHEIVGFHIDSGAAHLWVRDTAGDFQYAQYLTYSEPDSDQNFGHCVAMDGGRVVVGSSDNDFIASNGGLAQVFYSYAAAGEVGVTSQGTGTPGCDGPQTMGMTQPPFLGSQAFAFTCDNAPASSLGFLGLGTGADPAGTDYGLGFLMHIDPLSSTLILAGFQSDAAGDAEFPVAIPATPTLAGTTWHAQSVWTWTSCALPPLGFSSSDLMTFAFLQP